MVTFQTRDEAGGRIAELLSQERKFFQNPIILGIPRGGIPVGYPVAQVLECPLEVIPLRKLPVPDDPEAGFGAVTLDKVAIFNDSIYTNLQLPEEKVQSIIDAVYNEVLRRNDVYREGKPFPQLHDRSVIITDDGIASGYTMLAAVKYAREKNAKEIIVAAPVAHIDAYDMVKEHADHVYVIKVASTFVFAVASFYNQFPDLTDEEVMGYL